MNKPVVLRSSSEETKKCFDARDKWEEVGNERFLCNDLAGTGDQRWEKKREVDNFEEV